MKIGIDLSQIIYGTGVSVYSNNLVEKLLVLDKENEYILFGGSFRRVGELKKVLNKFKGEKITRKTYPLPPTIVDIIWNKLHILDIERLVGKLDVYHSSDWAQAPSSGFRVTTIHDLVPIKYPKLSSSKLVSNQTNRFKWIKKEVDMVIVPSNTTAQDVEKMGIKRENIKVIPEAVDPRFKPVKASQIAKIKRKFRISGKYMLSVGVNERKNTQRIIDAYEKVKSEVDIKLIVVGKPHIKVDSPRGVRFIGHIDSDMIVKLYSGAEVLVYPSLYEGFGLPILESFACKLPVVTTNFGSTKEVAGNAAVLVDPYNTESIVDGIFKALNDKDKLIKRGKLQLRKYSWKKTAKETLKVYKRLSS